MEGNTKQRLSAMLDVDLEHADTAPGGGSAAAAGPHAEDAGQRPATFSEWFQVATAEELRACLKSLVAERSEVASQVKDLLAEERAHRDWVSREEKAWTQAAAEPSAVKEPREPTQPREDLEAQAHCVPLRLSPDERTLLVILQGALHMSEYTDRVDIYHAGNKARRMALQIQQVCAVVAGLVVSNNFDVARKPLIDHGFSENMHFFRAVFEIGRRYKILNPDKLRGSYGKLIHMLQDSVKDEVVRQVGFECVAPVKTVASMLKTKERGAELLQDPLLAAATREIYDGAKSRAEIAAEVKEKGDALAELKRRYAGQQLEGSKPVKAPGDLGELLRGKQVETTALSAEDVQLVVQSIGDHFAFQRFNREPCDRMIEFLKGCFDPRQERDWSLEITRGRGGSCLSHSHPTQHTFVLQSLLLWREIMGNMFPLWQSTEEDLLDPSLRYRLCDTGQGLNRMQSAPRVSRMMKQILHKVQSDVGGWVGLSVVHLGDRDVPNALVFIDKYTQVPRILAPIVRTLDKLPEVYASSEASKKLIDQEFGGVEALRMMILQDFFRHGFDGSGDDGGSCVDGRLTSCWNWCSKIEKKKYFQAFLLTGFTGFDGGFESGAGW